METGKVRMTIDEIKDGALLRPDQVADIFKVTKKTIYNWVSQGKIKCGCGGGAEFTD